MSTETRPSLGLLVSLLFWIGLLVFGLWPFNFSPRNKVHWVGTGPGMIFDHYGQIYSLGRWSLRHRKPRAQRSFPSSFG
jgi:hypothetical protein